MGLFLGSLFCFTDSYDCFCNNTMLFWFLITVALWYCLKSGRIMPPALFIFFRIALTILGVYVSIYTFWIEICLKQVCFAIKEILKVKSTLIFLFIFLFLNIRKHIRVEKGNLIENKSMLQLRYLPSMNHLLLLLLFSH